MSQIPEQPQPPPTDDLQFMTLEPMTAAAGQVAQGPACVACHRPIASTYFAVGDKLVCPDCRDRYAAASAGGSDFGRTLGAILLGIIGSVAGALIWFAVRRIAHVQAGIVAIVVGLIVGGAVRAGSGGRGGRGYQVLAVILSYLAIAANFAPDIFEAHGHQYDLFLVKYVLAAPIILGSPSLIRLFIIGFALWEAWKINARRRVTFAGPFSLGITPAGSPATSGGQP